MKIICKSIAIIGLGAIALWPNFSAGLSHAIPEKSIAFEAKDSRIQLSGQPNLTLLAKTVADFFSSDRVSTESAMEIVGSAPGFDFNIYVQIKTIVQSPKQFRSEIVFGKPGGPVGKRYLVIGDGDRVWISHQERGIYTIIDRQEFDRGNEGFLIGFSSLFYLSTSDKIRETISTNNLSERNVVDFLHSFLLSESNKLTLQGSSRQFQGRDYYAYEYQDLSKGMGFAFLVDPSTATVEQVKITGKYQTIDIVLTEQIKQRRENPSINSQTFSFPPVAGLKKVESISIGPF